MATAQRPDPLQVSPTTIVLSLDGSYYAVVPCEEPELAHVWWGIAVKFPLTGPVAKAKAKPRLVRRAGTLVVG